MADPFVATYKWSGEPQLTIKYVGLFDFDGLYKLIIGWFHDRGYFFDEPSVKYKVPSPEGAEMEYEWTAWKKVTEYVKYWIKIYVHIFDMKDVEVVKDGKKEMLQRAQILFEIEGEVETDYGNRFKHSQLLQYVKEFYDRYFFKKPLDNYYGDQLWYFVYKLQAEIKEYLDMETKTNAFDDVW